MSHNLGNMLWAMTLCSLPMGLEYFPLKGMDIPSVSHPRTGNKLSFRNKRLSLISASEAIGPILPYVGVEMPGAFCWGESS